MLIPADIPRIASQLGYADVMEFARDNLLASPGALAIKDDQQIRIHTLVPQRGEDGACKFLKNNLCLIHQVAPYGCAFFSEHESRTVGDTKSTHALVNIIRDAESKGRYARVWRTLDAEGLKASAPEDIRARMNAESSDR
jgi:Fe-S-cluster containining protein